MQPPDGRRNSSHVPHKVFAIQPESTLIMTSTAPSLSIGRRRFTTVLGGLALTAGMMSPALAQSATAKVALQFGIGYLPLSVMQARNLWEQRAKAAGVDLKVEWQNYGNGSALNDALLTGSADLAAGGLTPMLKLWDKTRGNMRVRGIAALNTSPMLLVSNRADVKSITDFKPDDKIALSVPKVSIQAVVLQMAAAKQWGQENHDRLDAQTVSMKHTDAVIALASPRSPITAYFGSAPYQDRLLQQPGLSVILNSNDVIGGPSTFSAVWTTDAFREKNPKVYDAFLLALNDAMLAIQADKGRAVDDFIKVSGTSASERPLLLSIVQKPDNIYTMKPQATMKYAEFLAQIKSISVKPASWQDYFFEQSKLQGGS